MTWLWWIRCNGLVKCTRQVCSDNEGRLPPVLVFSSACFSSSRGSHQGTATTRGESYLPTAVRRGAPVFGWIWPTGQNREQLGRNQVAGGAEDGLRQCLSTYSLKNKEHKWSFTYTWFWSWNICIFFGIRFSSYFQLVLDTVSWTDSDFTEPNPLPLSEGKQRSTAVLKQRWQGHSRELDEVL